MKRDQTLNRACLLTICDFSNSLFFHLKRVSGVSLVFKQLRNTNNVITLAMCFLQHIVEDMSSL